MARLCGLLAIAWMLAWPAAGQGMVVLGTSLSHRAAWPDQLAAALPGCGLDPVVRITRPGAGSGWGVAQLDAVAAAAPGLVLIEFAINDADIADGLWLSESRENHREIALGLRERLPEAQLVFLSTNPARGLKGVLRPRLGRFYTMAGEVAAETGAGFVDLYPLWRAAPDWRGALPDGLHPSDAGFAAIVLDPLIDAVAGILACDVSRAKP